MRPAVPDRGGAVVMRNLCPSCLNGLPDDYEFDHVAIDKALAGDRAAYLAMPAEERAETLRTGLALGRDRTQLADLLHLSYAQVVAVVGHSSKSEERAELDAEIRRLWERQLSDGDIALCLGKTIDSICGSRRRLGLPANFGPGGRRARQRAEAA